MEFGRNIRHQDRHPKSFKAQHWWLCSCCWQPNWLGACFTIRKGFAHMITVCIFTHTKLGERPSQEVFGMPKMDALDFTKVVHWPFPFDLVFLCLLTSPLRLWIAWRPFWSFSNWHSWSHLSYRDLWIDRCSWSHPELHFRSSWWADCEFETM